MSEEEDKGFRQGMSESRGDPRLAFVLNAVLSTIFGIFIVWGGSEISQLSFTPVNAATMAVIIFTATYIVT